MDMSRLNCRTGLSYPDRFSRSSTAIHAAGEIQTTGDTAALGMDYQLRGKLAFVTAGAHGIGEANRNGIAVTAGGVIFMGTLGDATFRAFDKDNGKVLWEKKMDSIPKVFGPFTK